MSEKPYISIVIPVYNEKDSVPVLYGQVKAPLSALGKPYEVIFIDDGSGDGTGDALETIKDGHLKIGRSVQHLGKSEALTLGFSMARGDVIVTMDGDLQDDPVEIPRFVEALKDYDVVSGWRYERHDPLSKTLPSLLYNLLTRWLTGIPLHDFNCGYKAYRSEAVKGLKLSGGLHRYIPVLLHEKGCRVGEIKVEHHERLHGRSKYGYIRLFTGLVDLVRIRFFNQNGK